MKQYNLDFYNSVSILVLTYNSSKYILETLESIKAQTYPNLALIVSDDCSTDNTIEICKRWIQRNKSRFVDISILESTTNTGVSANGNRGYRACRTRWIKEIAGDDILMPNCIEDNIVFVSEHPETVLLFSNYQILKGHQILKSDLNVSFFELSCENQYNYLITVGNAIPAMTSFFNIDLMRKFNIKNDERIPLLEDWPKWLNALRAGVKFSYMDKMTVVYRRHNNALSYKRESPAFFYSRLLFYYLYQRNELISRSGEADVIDREIESAMKIYRSYYYNRFLLTTRIYNSILFQWKRIIRFFH